VTPFNNFLGSSRELVSAPNIKYYLFFEIIKDRPYLQGYVADCDIDSVEDRKHEHDHIFPFTKFSWSEDTPGPKQVRAYGSTQCMDCGQGPGKWELKE